MMSLYSCEGTGGSPGEASQGARRTSHVTRHTTHVTRHTSHVTRHLEQQLNERHGRGRGGGGKRRHFLWVKYSDQGRGRGVGGELLPHVERTVPV